MVFRVCTEMSVCVMISKLTQTSFKRLHKVFIFLTFFDYFLRKITMISRYSIIFLTNFDSPPSPPPPPPPPPLSTNFGVVIGDCGQTGPWADATVGIGYSYPVLCLCVDGAWTVLCLCVDGAWTVLCLCANNNNKTLQHDWK